jgi:hypothetical protein
MEGVVLTTDVLLVLDAELEVTFLSAAVLPEDTLPEACARLAVLLPVVLLFLLTVLLLPIPPLSDELLPNTRSDPV